MSVNVGYFRNWWGNWYAVDNRATTPADYTPFSIKAPVDARLPAAAATSINGLFDLNENKVGFIDELATNSSNFGKLIENWQGVDVNVTARLRNGITMQGGTSTGRRLSDACAMKAAVPEHGTGSRGANTSIAGEQSVVNPYCRWSSRTRPRSGDSRRTRFRGSTSWSAARGQSRPRVTSRRTSWRTTPTSLPILERCHSADPSRVVPPTSPSTCWSRRRSIRSNRNNIDLRVSKILRFGRTRTQVGFDIYNLLNADTATAFNQTFSPTSTTWLTPTTIVPARYVRFNLDVNF